MVLSSSDGVNSSIFPLMKVKIFLSLTKVVLAQVIMEKPRLDAPSLSKRNLEMKKNCLDMKFSAENFMSKQFFFI